MHRIISTVKSLLFVENEPVLKVSFRFYELKKIIFILRFGRYFVLFFINHHYESQNKNRTGINYRRNIGLS